jgi:hypothetical protein
MDEILETEFHFKDPYVDFETRYEHHSSKHQFQIAQTFIKFNCQLKLNWYLFEMSIVSI